MTSELDVYGDIPPEEATKIRDQEVEEYGEEVVLQADNLDLPGAILLVKQVQALKEEAHYYYEFLFCGGSYLRDRLPFVFNLGFEGKTGTGKTWCSKEAVFMSHRGEWISDTSEAALTTLLDRGCTLGFDEADALLRAHKNDLTEAILRMSSDPESKYWVKEWVPGASKQDKGQWELRPRQLLAFKVLNFAKRIDPALAARTIILGLDPTKENWIIQRSAYYQDVLAPVKLWLQREARKVREHWTTEALKALILSEEMNREMARLPSDFARDRQIGMVLLAVAHAFGWDVQAHIHEAIRSLDEYREDELQEEVRAFLLGHGDGERVWVADLRKRFNEEFRKGEKPLSAKWFGDLLSSLGVPREKDRSKGGRHYVHFVRSLLDTLTLSGVSGHPVPSLGTISPDGPDGLEGFLEGTVDRRNFRRVPQEDLKPGRCPKCRDLGDLTREDPNGKQFCEGCFEAMTGGS